MADLSKIKLNGTTYNFKDAEARNKTPLIININTNNLADVYGNGEDLYQRALTITSDLYSIISTAYGNNKDIFLHITDGFLVIELKLNAVLGDYTENNANFLFTTGQDPFCVLYGDTTTYHSIGPAFASVSIAYDNTNQTSIGLLSIIFIKNMLASSSVLSNENLFLFTANLTAMETRNAIASSQSITTNLNDNNYSGIITMNNGLDSPPEEIEIYFNEIEYSVSRTSNASGYYYGDDTFNNPPFLITVVQDNNNWTWTLFTNSEDTFIIQIDKIEISETSFTVASSKTYNEINTAYLNGKIPLLLATVETVDILCPLLHTEEGLYVFEGAINEYSDNRIDFSIHLQITAMTNGWNAEVYDAIPSSGSSSQNIPTRTSDLINDSGFITSSSIPTQTSDLINDSGFISEYIETDPVFSISAAAQISSDDISNWNNKSDFSGNYEDLSNQPTIPTVPTNISAFTNDSGYLTNYTETDPIFTSSAAANITSSNITTWNNKQNALTFDSTPTVGSSNPVTSSGIKAAIPTKTSDLTNDSSFATIQIVRW